MDHKEQAQNPPVCPSYQKVLSTRKLYSTILLFFLYPDEILPTMASRVGALSYRARVDPIHIRKYMITYFGHKNYPPNPNEVEKEIGIFSFLTTLRNLTSSFKCWRAHMPYNIFAHLIPLKPSKFLLLAILLHASTPCERANVAH